MAAKRRRLDGCLGNFQTAFAAFERRKKGRGVDHSPAVKTDDSSVLAIFSKRSDSFFFEETNRKAEAKGFGGLGKSGRSISFPGADFVRVLKERCRQLPRFFPAARERRAKKRLIVSTKRSAFFSSVFGDGAGLPHGPLRRRASFPISETKYHASAIRASRTGPLSPFVALR